MSTKRDREKAQQIQVFVRTRPLNTQERDIRQTSCIEITGPKELSVRQQHGRKYTFDRVFAPHVKQVDVYKTVVFPLISEVLAGYNCTVFAYGQTGSGKTHTMIGASSLNCEVPWQDDDSAGIVPRAMANLFEDLQLTQQEHAVRVSYIELYNEEVYDLLAENCDNARIRLYEDQHQKGSVIIQGIEQVTVVNNKDVKKILDKGQEKRRTASTLMNSQSSRSHTVFTITVHIREPTVEGEVLVKTGKLNLVDLAGSENISRSGAVEKRAREAGSINQSLLTLGRVIKSLVERSGHVPYRESKLTRILQDSLGGRTKTSIIATISPAISNLEETLSTLEYANRARNITNRPEVNQRMSQKALMDQYAEEMERLRRDLRATRSGNGVYLAQENYDQLIADSDNDKQELSLKIQHIRDLERSLKDLEEQRDELQLEWKKMNESFDKTNNELNICRDKLIQTENEKNRQEFLATRYEEKAGQLYDEVQSLMTTVKTSKNIDAALREKIEKLYTTAKENCNTSKQMSAIIRNKYEDMCEDLAYFKDNCKVNKDRMSSMLSNIQEKHCGYFDMNEVFMDKIMHQWRTYANSHQAFADSSQTDFECWMQQFIISCNNHRIDIRKQREEENSLLKKLGVVVDNINTDCNQSVKKMKSLLEKSHHVITNLCQDFEEGSTSQTNDLLTDVSKLKVSTEKKINCNNMEEQIAIGQETLKGIQKSLEMLHSNFAMLQSTCKASQEENKINLETVNRLDCGIANQGSFNNTNLKKIIKSNQESVSLLKKSLDHSEKSLVLGKKMQTEILESLDANNVKMDEKVEEALVVNINNQKDIFLVKNRNVFNTDNLELVTNSNNLSNYLVQQTSQIKSMAAELNANVSEAHNCIHDFADSASQFEKQLVKDLSECQDTITNFTNVKYKEILPSGDTPVRMQYYCSNLNPPTPKEKILGRFQERLRTMETIEEPNGDTETVN